VKEWKRKKTLQAHRGSCVLFELIHVFQGCGQLNFIVKNSSDT